MGIILVAMRVAAPVLCLLFLSFSLGAQMSPQSFPILPTIPAEGPSFSGAGDAAVARRYLEWAQRESVAGRNTEALAVLERGSDFGAVSSDLSFFLAVLRSAEGRSRLVVLEACRRALETARWERYAPEDARLLEARTLSELRRFEEALNVLGRCNPERYETQYIGLLAARGIALSRGEDAALARALAFTMDRFPRETDPVRLLFDYASREETNNSLRPLIDLALRRFPVLVESDPELAYKAVPFMRDKEEARRYTASYRAAGNPNPASLPAALNLGLIDGKLAVEELLALSKDKVSETSRIVVDKELIVTVNGLLRSQDEREFLRRNLLTFSGVITEDEDRDGVVETWTSYRNGMIQEYRYDPDQNGDADLTVSFVRGLPERAVFVINPPDELPTVPPGKADRVLLRWERYPAVLDAEREGKRYIPRPLDYFFTPFRFVPLVFGGPDYPERETFLPLLTERSLLSFAVIMEQPSVDFPGRTERIELSGGIPVNSVVYVKGMKVSETRFRDGRPVIQFLDLDMDGRMETIRRYDPNEAYLLLSTESDLDGDGIYEYAETLQSDGTVRRSWDLNRDGVRETNR